MLRSGFSMLKGLGIHNRWPIVSGCYASSKTVFSGKVVGGFRCVSVAVLVLRFLSRIEFETELLVYSLLLVLRP